MSETLSAPESSPASALGKYKDEIPAHIEAMIGGTIVAWSRVEQAMEELIWTWLDFTVDQGRVITSSQDGKRKISMLRAIGIRKIKGRKIKKFHELIPILRNCYDHRNTMAHGIWVTFKSGGFAALSLRIDVPEHLDQTMTTATPYSVEDIRVIRNVCITCMNYMIDLRKNWKT
jgi:hypothetical protein